MITRAGLNAEVSEFNEKGAIVLKSLFSEAEFQQLQAELVSLGEALAETDTWPLGIECSITHDGRRHPTRIEPIIPHSAGVRDLAQSSSAARLAESFLGAAVCLLEDKLIFKPPGSLNEYLPHQEIHWTSEYSSRNLMLAVAITDCTVENGPLFFVPGSHKNGLMLHVNDVVSHASTHVAQGVPLLMKAGDIAIVHGGTVHFSGPNLSSDFRTMLFLTFNAESEGDWYDVHRKKWNAFYHGSVDLTSI